MNNLFENLGTGLYYQNLYFNIIEIYFKTNFKVWSTLIPPCL